MDGVGEAGRDELLEAVLENRRKHGCLKEVQAPYPAQAARSAEEGRQECGEERQGHEGGVVSWRDNDQPAEILRDNAQPARSSPTLNPSGAINLTRMTSTRRYMAELEPDEQDEADNRSTWHSAWGSEARDSVASLEPLKRRPDALGAKGRLLGEGTRESSMTAASVDGDPFSFSAYTGIPSPRDGAFPLHASASIPSTSTSSRSSRSHRPATLSPSPPTPDSPVTPIVRIGPPSPTTEAFLQSPHDSAMWSEVLPPSQPVRPPPDGEAPEPASEAPINANRGRIRSQTFSSAPKNFSRPFIPPTPASPPFTQLPDASRLEPIDAPVAASGPPSLSRTGTLDSAHPSPIDRSSSLGHASSAAVSLERFSSIGHSSQTSHGTHATGWADEGKRAGGFEEEARRAIALARGKSLRNVADRSYEESESVSGMEELRTEAAESVYGGEEGPLAPASTAAIASGLVEESMLSSPPPSSVYSTLEYDDPAAQYAVYSADEYLQPPSPFTGSRPPPSPPVPPAFQLSPSSPLDPHAFARSPFSPFSSPLRPSSPSQLSSSHSASMPAPRQRKVLRKPRPPHSSTESTAMTRSVSDGSSAPSNSSRTSRGEKKPAPPTLLSQSLPPSSASPAFGSRYSPSPTPTSASVPTMSHSASLSPSSHFSSLPPHTPAPLSAPLSQAEFARLAASRPAFGRGKSDFSSRSEGARVLKNVQGARVVQPKMVTGGAGARGVIVRHGLADGGSVGDDDVEQLSESMSRSMSDQGHYQHLKQQPSIQSLYSDNYSFYSLPPSHDASPTTPSVPISSPLSALVQQHSRGLSTQSSLSTLRKLDMATKGKRPSIVGRTPSGKEVRREPVTPDDYLQLGIDLHEQGELERAAWSFEQSAKKDGGCGAGMLMYGLTLRHGWGCQVNAPLGFRYIQSAAESVVHDLDRVVFGGRSLSEAEANTKAAKNELVLALYEMGQSYRFGLGVEKNKKMAVSYFKLAADLGDVDAQQDVAFCYSNGKGCEKDKTLAAHYYRLAIAQGASDFGLSWVYKEKYLPGDGGEGEGGKKGRKEKGK
ncbi:cell cycle inhibitor, Nif1 [Rhodotorula toruloides]|uniref:Cell cycle inhibitor, Nif1 n=1 Tax=Rhodotorula toruloides TaxID=5286 RepID=A0A511KJK3_RHOTO|nr:cell cycle inhibitor, Nif1 [Rhodotorula toruloides]